MSVTSGFFNSLNGDRKYNAEQMSAIFNGIINDGIFANIGTAFGVRASTGTVITVGIGRAWFDSAWIYNDAILPITLDVSEILLDRIDAVVIDIDHTDAVRFGDILVVKGTPSSTPQYPTLANEVGHHQYPLAYIYRGAGTSDVKQANITNMIGTSSAPYVTGILQVQNIDNIVAQWQDQWTQWYTQQTSESDNQISKWIGDKQLEFNTWFSNLQTMLNGDVAATLAEQILELKNKFNTLAKEYAIYQSIDDSDGTVITDSYSSELDGRIVYKLA